jgi:protein CLEC16A
MKIILEKAKKYNLINDIMNECDNININLLNKKISFKGNKKENNIFEKQINIKSKNCKNNFYFDCNEEKPQKNNNNKIIKEALTKIMKKQTGKNDNIISLINNALKGVESTKKEKNIIIDNNNKIKYNKSKEKINKDFNTEERINKKDKKIDIINIDKIISVDDNILKENTNKIKSKNIKEFADNLNSYVSRYKTSEIKEKKVASKIIKENNTFITPLSKKEKNVEINLDKNKYINNNINININNDLNDKNSNILNSIMNFKIINNNDSDIHININNNSNILNNNNNNKSTISIDNNNNTTNNKELYSEEENSEDQKEFVKEIKENKIYDINNDIKNIEEKISIIKEEMLKLIGGTDYNYIMNLYDSTNNNDNVDKIYEKIENFVDKYYDEDKKDNFNNLYYQLISLNHNLNKKENILI